MPTCQNRRFPLQSDIPRLKFYDTAGRIVPPPRGTDANSVPECARSATLIESKVIRKDSESVEKLIKRFRHRCQKLKILKEYRRHQFFKSRSERQRDAMKRRRRT